MEGDDIRNLIRMANIELSKICTYFRTNLLSLHPEKTKYIIISNSQVVHESNFKLYINDNNPDQSTPDNIKLISRIKSSDEVPAI